MSRENKETIRISFGPTANALSSHLCNLDGFASTKFSNNDINVNDDGATALCRPSVTHRSVRYDSKNTISTSNRRVYVPRVLFIDTQDGFGKNRENEKISWDAEKAKANDVSTWDGKVEFYSQRQKLQDVQNEHRQQTEISDEDNDSTRFQLFHKAVETLSERTSRYECPTSTIISQASASSDSRYMNWDDLVDERYDEEEELNEYEVNRKKEQIRLQKLQQIHHIHDDASTLWNLAYFNCQQTIGWYDYLLPPFPPSHTSMLSLPFFAHNHYNDHYHDTKFSDWDHYVTGYQNNDLINSHWREDVMSEKLRHLLEETDALGGFQILSDGCGMGMYPGLTTSVLQEIHDECKSAKLFSILTTGENDDEDKLFSKDNETSKTKEFISFRKHVNYALSLHGITSHSHLTLPIHLSQCGKALRLLQPHVKPNHFQNTASAALALECATLPYRLSSKQTTFSSSSLPIAMAGSAIASDPYLSTDTITFSDFVASLKPGNRHSLLSIDACLQLPKEATSSRNGNSNMNMNFTDRLCRGMDQVGGGRGDNDRNRGGDSRIRQKQKRRDEFPGMWMKDGTLFHLSSNTDDTTSVTGTVTSPTFSSQRYNNNYLTTNVVHDYFAVATSLRPPESILMKKTSPLSVFTQPLLQGLIYRGRSPQQIRSLPDRISTCVVPSSVSFLTRHGCYWDSIWDKNYNNNDGGGGDFRDNILSWTVLSNSTRSHETIGTQITHLKQGLKGTFLYDTKSKNYKRCTQNWKALMKKEIQMGRLPEEEDCEEVLEYFSDLSNVYEPHGLDNDDDYIDLE